MKICNKCKTEKPIECFSPHKGGKNGLHSSCKLCEYERKKKWRSDNKDKDDEIKRKWALNNKEKIDKSRKKYKDNNPNKIKISKDKWRKNNLEYNKNYYQNNKELINERNSNWRKINKDVSNKISKKYRDNNKEKRTALAAYRRASKPSWLSQEDTEFIHLQYAMANVLSKTTGEKYHVDHIIPLKGKNVSGLHVPLNLQVIEAYKNFKKSNKVFL